MAKWVLATGEFRLSGYAIRKLVELGSPVAQRLSLGDWYGGEDFVADYAEDLRKCQPIADGYRMCPMSGALFKGGFVHWYEDSPGVRTDPHLVAVVEMMKKQAAGPECVLRIVDVPDDARVELKTSPAGEYLEETHRIWR